MRPAAAGTVTMLTGKMEDVLLPMQFVPYTLMLPPEADEEKLTAILFVFAPDAMVAPEGKDHTYPVAFAIAGTEYETLLAPRQIRLLPLIVPGVAGRVPPIEIVFVTVEPEQGPFTYVTPIIPVPPGNDEGKFTVIVPVPLPDATTAPLVANHEYVVTGPTPVRL
jgi:hypothetical protein